MTKTQASKALQNAVAYLKGQKLIKKEIEISIQTGFSKGTISSYLSGNHVPSENFIKKFQEVFNIDLRKFTEGPDVVIPDGPGASMEALIRIESLEKVKASYLAEVYAHLKGVPATKVLKEMEQMADD